MSLLKVASVSIALLSLSPDAVDSIKDDVLSVTPSQVFFAPLCYAAAYTIAHSSLDQAILDQYNTLTDSPSGQWAAKMTKPLGEVSVISGYATSLLALRGIDYISGRTSKPTTIMETILKAYVIGGPICISSQRLIGSPRPNQAKGSEWNFLAHATGVSGHAFFSAVPFFVISNLTNEPATKALFNAIGLLTGFSRMTHRAHYPSQVLLGWAIAKNSADLVTRREKKQKITKANALHGTLTPTFSKGSFCLTYSLSY